MFSTPWATGAGIDGQWYSNCGKEKENVRGETKYERLKIHHPSVLVCSDGVSCSGLELSHTRGLLGASGAPETACCPQPDLGRVHTRCLSCHPIGNCGQSSAGDPRQGRSQPLLCHTALLRAPLGGLGLVQWPPERTPQHLWALVEPSCGRQPCPASTMAGAGGGLTAPSEGRH